MYSVVYHENLDIKNKKFQNKFNVVEFLKSIVDENDEYLRHYYYISQEENNIITSNDNIWIKYIGNKNNKDYDLFSLIHNNIYIKSWIKE